VPKRYYAPEPQDGFVRLGYKKSSITLTLSIDCVRALRYVAKISRLKPRRLLDMAVVELASLAYSGHNFGQIREATKRAQITISTPFRKYSGPEEFLIEDMVVYLKKCRRDGVEPSLKRAFPGCGSNSRSQAYERVEHKLNIRRNGLAYLKSSKNSETGVTPVTSRKSRARVQAT
jgi:hypothetical protein